MSDTPDPDTPVTDTSQAERFPGQGEPPAVLDEPVDAAGQAIAEPLPTPGVNPLPANPPDDQVD